LASSLLHATALAAAVAVSMLHRPAAIVPNVRIVALGGGSRATGAAAAPKPAVRKPEPVAVKPPAPAAKPEPKPKKESKTPPARPPAKAAEKSGTLPPQKREIVSKGPAATAAAAASAASTAASAAAGASGVGLETDADPGPLSGYLGLLQDKVANAWVAPALVGRKGEVRCQVFFVIERRGGAPVDLAVQVSSGDPGFDRAAMRAVLNAAPLAPLPPGWGTDSIGIRFTFFQNY